MTIGRLLSFSSLSVAAIVVATAVGCSQEDGAAADQPVAKIPVESGKVNGALVGSWESENKMSTFVFDKNGKFSTKTAGSINTNSQSGTIKIDGQSKGIWSEKDGKLMMRYEDGVEGIFDWKASPDGKTLELKAKRSPKPSKYFKRA